MCDRRARPMDAGRAFARVIRLRAVLPAMLLAALLAACGMQEAIGGSATPAGAGTRPERTGPNDIILATTTSAQDSGLLDELIPRFEQQTGYRVKVVALDSESAIALGTRGEADLVLSPARALEQAGVDAGDRRQVMFDDFVLVGPPDDPAGAHLTGDAAQALAAVASVEQPYISHGGTPGIQQVEARLWAAAGIEPAAAPWYVRSEGIMAQALEAADERRAYTISDRGTFLALRPRLDLAVLYEHDERLINVYHLVRVSPERFPAVNAAGAAALSDFLVAPEAQALIAAFGASTYGQALFTPCAQGVCSFAQATARGP